MDAILHKMEHAPTPANRICGGCRGLGNLGLDRTYPAIDLRTTLTLERNDLDFIGILLWEGRAKGARR